MQTYYPDAPQQEALFEVKIRKPESGQIALAHTRKIPLPAIQTADLMKREDMGEGDIISFIGGTGVITGKHIAGGVVTWTVEVGDLQVEL